MKEKTNQLKKVLEEQRKEYQQYFDFVYHQKFQKEIRAIGEILGHHTEKLAAIEKMIAKNTEDIEIIKLDTQFIKNGLKKIEIIPTPYFIIPPPISSPLL